ncbi:MAG: DUF4493 domain-containing protein [Bacteroidales bacterium]|nr:DUF4493 domain-containing protein [Bacteroidales bacterium]
MKKKLLFALACILASVSCSKDGNAGSVQFTLTSDIAVQEIVKSRVSDFTELPSPNDFVLTIKDSNGEKVWEGKLSQWSAATAISVGTYSVTATYGDVTVEGAGKPCYEGSTNFSVAGSSTSNVKIPVDLKNCIVKLVFSDAFKNYFTSGKFTITTGNSSKFVVDNYSPDALFMEPYQFNLKAELTNQGKAVQNFEKNYNDLAAATLYTLKFDASNIGGLVVTVTFNDNVTTVDLGDVEIN